MMAMAEGRADALPEGTVLQVYTLGPVLGAGGFGITYRAAEQFTERPVAIKEFLPTAIAQRAPDGVSVRPLSRGSVDFGWGLERFRLEARTLIALKHKNVVPVLQYFEANGTGYLVMEYQNGRTLGARLKPDKHLGPEELERVLAPLLDALAAVHAKGFLHRDIKPDNIFLREDGTPLLLDFGAARQAVGAKSQNLTAIVSEGYAPLEQYESGSVQGSASDIYALGCTLYRCMTGVRPVSAPKRSTARLEQKPDPVEPLARILREPYRPGLVAAVEAAMRLAAGDRPQSIAAFRALLAAPGPGAADEPSSRHLKRRERGQASNDGPVSPPVVEPGPVHDTAWETIDRRRLAAKRRRLRIAGVAGVVAVLLGAGGYFGFEWYQALRFDRLTAAATTAIGTGALDDAERGIEAAARIRPDDARLSALRARLAEARRAELGRRRKPQLVLPVRDCADCPELVEIPGGRPFVMGSPETEVGSYPKERPQRSVYIARAFLMGPFEVTVGQYRAFLRKSGHKQETPCATFDPSAGTYRVDAYAGWSKPDFPIADNHPVVCVSWSDAQAYAAWLSRETGKTYRLPSEAEWEYAARAGAEGAQPWGADGKRACEYANAADKTGHERLPKDWDAFACNDGHAFTAPVGSFKPNAFGLHDMLGNVWEWVEDCFNQSYSGAPADGAPWRTGDCATRVMRGGAWISQIRDVRFANRGYNRGDRGYYSVGFRVVREK
jgi:formylglycine-generating enzyme required for sulfatase activity/serine/threonine protein kinase